MSGVKYLLYAGSLSAIVFALAKPSATAQEVRGHILCRDVSAFSPEQLGDREGHALSIGPSSCEVTEGPVVGAVQNETSMWDGPKAKELSDYGVARKPGDTFAFQHTDDSGEVFPLRRGEFAPLRTSVATPRRVINRDRLLDRTAFRAV
jgi:hypothetical protein